MNEEPAHGKDDKLSLLSPDNDGDGGITAAPAAPAAPAPADAAAAAAAGKYIDGPDCGFEAADGGGGDGGNKVLLNSDGLASGGAVPGVIGETSKSG